MKMCQSSRSPTRLGFVVGVHVLDVDKGKQIVCMCWEGD
jgi:hypothetical protein